MKNKTNREIDEVYESLKTDPYLGYLSVIESIILENGFGVKQTEIKKYRDARNHILPVILEWVKTPEIENIVSTTGRNWDENRSLVTERFFSFETSLNRRKSLERIINNLK